VKGIISLVLISLLLAAPAQAIAQEAAVRKACDADIEQHCAGVQPGAGRIKACVEEHFGEFSEPCRQALLNNVTVVKACRADVQRTCSGVQPGAGGIQACMKDHIAGYSERCKQAIATAKFGNR